MTTMLGGGGGIMGKPYMGFWEQNWKRSGFFSDLFCFAPPPMFFIPRSTNFVSVIKHDTVVKLAHAPGGGGGRKIICPPKWGPK